MDTTRKSNHMNSECRTSVKNLVQTLQNRCQETEKKKRWGMEFD